MEITIQTYKPRRRYFKPGQKPPKVEIRQFFDDDENCLIIYNRDKTVKIFLKLKQENYRRHIGTITKSTRTFVICRNRLKHLHRKSNSYGFNYHIIKHAKLFDTISLSDEYSNWKIPKQFIIDSGKNLYFAKRGFELQRFCSLEDIEPFKINTEKTRF